MMKYAELYHHTMRFVTLFSLSVHCLDGIIMLKGSAAMSDELLLKEKKRLRRELLAKRSSLSEDYLRAAGDDIAGRLLSSPLYAAAGSIFVYVSMPGEPPTDRIISQALSEGREVYVPKCAGGKMFAVRIQSPADLRPGTMGIPEPELMEETKTADELGLIIVPCVAAAEDGRRLGHGGGYYDRFLSRERENAVCLCYRQLLCPDIPEGRYDVRIRHILTEGFEIGFQFT